MKSIIEWIDIKREKPIECGWYLVVLRPRNFKDFEDEKEYKNWIKAFGLNKVWFNNDNGKFWNGADDITERIMYWAPTPSIPLI